MCNRVLCMRVNSIIFFCSVSGRNCAQIWLQACCNLNINKRWRVRNDMQRERLASLSDRKYVSYLQGSPRSKETTHSVKVKAITVKDNEYSMLPVTLLRVTSPNWVLLIYVNKEDSNFQGTALCNVTSCGLIETCWRFGEAGCLSKVVKFIRHYMTWHNSSVMKKEAELPPKSQPVSARPQNTATSETHF